MASQRDRELVRRLEVQATVAADGIPGLAAVPRADGLSGLRIWCRHCRDWHLHGEGYGHRHARCRARNRQGRPIGSPYRATGYRLVAAGSPPVKHAGSTADD